MLFISEIETKCGDRGDLSYFAPRAISPWISYSHKSTFLTDVSYMPSRAPLEDMEREHIMPVGERVG